MRGSYIHTDDILTYRMSILHKIPWLQVKLITKISTKIMSRNLKVNCLFVKFFQLKYLKAAFT